MTTKHLTIVVWPEIGSRWRELYGDESRIVTVVALDKPMQRVQIKTSRKTWASLHRFNGRRGGYRLVEYAKDW